MIEWHKNVLKPLCNKLKNIYKHKDMSDREKKKQFKLLFKLFDKLTEELQSQGTIFLSGSNTDPSAPDIMIYSEISTIVCMYAGHR